MDGDLKAIEMAISRASVWFQIHADQRLKLFNFYVLIFLGSLAGFGTVVKEKLYSLELGIPLLLLLLTYSFKELDKRSAALVKHAETALDVLESKLEAATGLVEVKLIQAAKKKDGVISYRQAFNIVFITAVLACIAGVTLAVFHIENTKP
jgi:hypothetical protein